MRRTLTATTAIALTAALGACTSTSVNTTPVGANQVQTSAAHSSAAAAPATSSSAAKKAGVGDTINLNSTKAGNTMQVTLTKVVDPSTAANEFSKPDAGKRYVAVQIRIANHGQATYSEDPQILVKAVDALGQHYDVDFGTDTTAGPSMDSGLKLAPGDATLGFLVFQVPTGQKIVTVQYTLSTLGGAVAQWTTG